MIGTDEVLEARNSRVGQDLVEPTEQLALELLVLDDRLDRGVGALEVLERGREGEALAGGGAVVLLELAGAHGAVERLVDRGARRSERSSSASTTVTSTPERAHTSAMPEPIRPPPITPTRMAPGPSGSRPARRRGATG